MLIPILIMSIMGILFGLGLAFASRIFRVDIDPKIEKILSVLPGTNCGACGRAGCAGLAEGIAKGELNETSCAVGGEDVSNKISDILGTERKALTKKVARVRCGGGEKSKDKYIYKGGTTCSAVKLLAGGQKLCKFACLGFGDCIKVCPFDAIHMSPDGIPIIDSEKCTACGKCIDVCPKNIISLEDVQERYYVQCLSQDKAGVVKNACKVGCIGCKICEKLSKGIFIVENNLARIDYCRVDDEDTGTMGLCVEKCPTRCIVKSNK